MCRQFVSHPVRRFAKSGLVVSVVSVEMLAVLGSARSAEFARTTGSVIGVIHETDNIEASLVLPEIRIFISGHHHGNLAAFVLLCSPC